MNIESVLLGAVTAIGAYTNLAGNVISGAPIRLDRRMVTMSNDVETVAYPLSIFPDAEQRRIAVDFGQPRIPAPVRHAVGGMDKAIARSRKRAEAGLCSEEESRAFCEQTEKARAAFLDRQVKEGVITPAERRALQP